MRKPFRHFLWIIIVIVLAVIVLTAMRGWRDRRPAPGSDAGLSATVMLVRLEERGGPPSGRQGCGGEFVPHKIPVISTRLTSILSALSRFDPPEGLENPMRDQGLQVIDVKDGVIDLAGEPQLGGLCDRPRLKGQIERTVTLYGGEFEIRLNGSASEYQCMKDVWGKCG